MTSIEVRRRQLEGRRDELHDRIRRIEHDRQELMAPVLAGVADEPEDEDVLEDLERSSRREIRMIDAALDRLRAGAYGTCVRCGDAISEERLDVLPATPVCRECAEGDRRAS